MLPWNPALKKPQGSRCEGQGVAKKDGGPETRCEEWRRKCMWRKERGRGPWHQAKLGGGGSGEASRKGAGQGRSGSRGHSIGHVEKGATT